MPPNMHKCSYRRGRRGRRGTLRKTLGRRALPEGHDPQSRMRDIVMSLLEKGRRERQMPLGAAGFDGPSQPGLDKTRPGNMLTRWPTWHRVRTGGGPSKSP